MRPETAPVEHPLLDPAGMGGTERRNDGVALLVVAALLAMLGALATLFLAQAVRARPSADAAGTIAASGLEYAAARLRERSGYPLFPRAAENRADDWSFRDDPSVPAERSVAPSYARGEGIPGGAWTDLDGDGRFSAWSGRLRGGENPFAGRFSLKVEPKGGKIPVNRLGRHGSLIPKPLLASLLNNLGSRVLPAGHPRRARLATSNPNRFIETSRLGNDIQACAPDGGIAGPAELAGTLRQAGWPDGPDGAPWGLAEILPHVTCAPAIELSPQFRVAAPDNTGGGGTIPVPALDLATATTPALEAAFLYATHPPATGLWRPAAAGEADPDSGREFSVSNLVLHPEDAGAAAGAILAHRDACLAAGTPLRIPELRRVLLDGAAVLFPPPASLAAFPEEAARWSLSKADLAFLCVTPDAPPHFATAPASLHTGGLVRPGIPDLDWLLIKRTEIPAGPAFPDPAGPFINEGIGPGPLALLTARPPLLFEIASAALRKGGPATSRAERSGILETGSPLFLGSQQDLENVPSSDLAAALPRTGVFPTSIAGSGRILANNNGRTYRPLASLPSWDWQSYPPNGSAGFTGYSPFFGALTLAGLEAGPQVAHFYWAFGEALGGLPQTFLSETRSTPPAPRINWAGQHQGDPPTMFRPLDPAAGPLHTRAQPLFTPHQVTGNGDLSPALGCLPDGFLSNFNVPGGLLDYASFEFWTAPCLPPEPGIGLQTVFSLRGFNLSPMGGEIPFGEFTVEIEGLAPGPSDSPPELVFHCRGEWGTLGGGAPVSLRIPFTTEEDRTRPHFCQMEIKFERRARQTTVKLRVDNQETASILSGSPVMPQITRIHVTGVDEFRICTTLPANDLYDITRGMGRFARSGRYVSPRYTFFSSGSYVPRKIRHVQWNGHVPPGFPTGALLASIDMNGRARPLGEAGDISDFSSLGETPFFQYRVDFNATAVQEPLLDTPVFESVELVLGLPKGTSGWLRYE